MSDIPDCRECGAQLELDADELWWVCKNKSCPHYLERQVRAFENVTDIRVSAVITSHDPRRVGMLGRAIESAIRTGADEVIVVRPYSGSMGKLDGKFVDFRTVDDSPGGKQVDGVCVAHGDVVAFLDDDDTWRDGKVDLLRERFSKNPDLVLLDHSNFVVDENGTILSRELSINGKWLKSSDIAIRRSWATPRAWLVRSAQRENDLVWVFLAEVDAPNGIEVVDLPLTSWTHHASNISRPRSPTVEEFCHKESEHCRVRIRAEKVMLRYGDLRLVDRMAPTLVYHRRRLAGFEFLSALEEGHHPRGTARRFLRSYGHADRLLALALMAAISPRVARLILFRLGSYNGVPGAKVAKWVCPVAEFHP